MTQIKKKINEVNCDPKQRNEVEIKHLYKFFKANVAFPSPVIDENNEVIAFHNTYFLLKNLGFESILFVKKEE
ncbi:MAG: hypothetical protein ACOCQG_03340 [Candidatus Nanoarchaeia archaeon]